MFFKKYFKCQMLLVCRNYERVVNISLFLIIMKWLAEINSDMAFMAIQLIVIENATIIWR